MLRAVCLAGLIALAPLAVYGAGKVSTSALIAAAKARSSPPSIPAARIATIVARSPSG
jgi:hypothetical protein